MGVSSNCKNGFDKKLSGGMDEIKQKNRNDVHGREKCLICLKIFFCMGFICSDPLGQENPLHEKTG
jgi:hypothetical protein